MADQYTQNFFLPFLQSYAFFFVFKDFPFSEAPKHNNELNYSDHKISYLYDLCWITSNIGTYIDIHIYIVDFEYGITSQTCLVWYFISYLIESSKLSSLHTVPAQIRMLLLLYIEILRTNYTGSKLSTAVWR